MKVNKLNESSEIKQRADKHKKHNKGLNPDSTLNKDAGDVEHNVAMFNHANTAVSGPCVNPNGPMAEELEDNGVSGGSVTSDEKKLSENTSVNSMVELHYDDLEVSVTTRGQRPSSYSFEYDQDEAQTVEDHVAHDYRVNRADVVDIICQELTEEDYPAIDDATDEDILAFVNGNFDDLFSKYEQKILDYFEKDAREDARKTMSESVMKKLTESVTPAVEDFLIDLGQTQDSEIYRMYLKKDIGPEACNELKKLRTAYNRYANVGDEVRMRKLVGKVKDLLTNCSDKVYEGLNESANQYIIMAVAGDGKKQYYNMSSSQWVSNGKDATIFDDMDDARAVWFKLDKKPFKRVFIPNYDPERMNESITPVEQRRQFAVDSLLDNIHELMSNRTFKNCTVRTLGNNTYKVTHRSGNTSIRVKFDVSVPSKNYVFSIDGQAPHTAKTEREAILIISNSLNRKRAKSFDIPVEEGLSDRIRSNDLEYDDSIDAWTASQGNTEIQLQDREFHTHEFRSAKNSYGRSYIDGQYNKRPRVSSMTWGRVWKDDKLVKQFEGPKYQVRADMAKYLDASGNLDEAWNPNYTDCPMCGDLSFDPNSGRCTQCSYSEVPSNDYQDDEFINEANQRCYLTVYAESSVSGPEEGGYTSYGWTPISSKPFNTIESARDALKAAVEGDEIIEESPERVHCRDNYGDEYIIVIETARKRGHTESPAKTWSEAEFGGTPRKYYFDRQGKVLDHNPREVAKAKREEKALRDEFLVELQGCKTYEDVLDLYTQDKYRHLAASVSPEVGNRLKEIQSEMSESFSGENDSDELDHPDQEFDSAKTSINSTKLPAVYRMITIPQGTVGVDFGGGSFDNAVEHIRDLGATLCVYDPYNRSAEHNREVIKTLKGNGGADWAINSNVLNVIKEPEARKAVLKNISRITKSGAPVYITVYEGRGDGQEGATKSGYQLNRKTQDYLAEIQEVFPDAVRKGKLIVAHNSSGNVNESNNAYSYKDCTIIDVGSGWKVKDASQKWVGNEFATDRDAEEFIDSLNESFLDSDDNYEYVVSKSVLDSDGFYTDYTWYKTVDGLNVFVFGDNDIYKPADGYIDHEEEDDTAAQEWFDSYNGFEEDIVDENLDTRNDVFCVDDQLEWTDLSGVKFRALVTDVNDDVVVLDMMPVGGTPVTKTFELTCDSNGKECIIADMASDKSDAVYVYPPHEDLEESTASNKVVYPNGLPVTDIDLEDALDYQYGTDRNPEWTYTGEEMQRAVDYWIYRTEGYNAEFPTFKDYQDYLRDKRQRMSLKESYNIKFYQIFEAPMKPTENGKMIGQRDTLSAAIDFGEDRCGSGKFFIKGVCDDGRTRYVDFNSDAKLVMTESLVGKRVRGTNSYGQSVGKIGTVIDAYPNLRDHYGNYPIIVRYADGSTNDTMSFWVNIVPSDPALELDAFTWNDAYSAFEEIVDKHELSEVEEINNEVTQLYQKHKGEPAWDEAYRRWNEFSDDERARCEEDLESIDESKENRPLYIIKDSHGNQLSAPNPDDEELWDRVASMEARGRRGLCVVAYTGKKDSLKEWNEFSDDDVEDDLTHAAVYGGDSKYCKECGAVKKYDEDGFAYCPECCGELDESYWYNDPELRQKQDKLIAELEADGFEETDGQAHGTKHWTFFRKRVDGKGVWKAIFVDTGSKEAAIIDVTYGQVRGYEPLDSMDVLRKQLGKALLPN